MAACIPLTSQSDIVLNINIHVLWCLMHMHLIVLPVHTHCRDFKHLECTYMMPKTKIKLIIKTLIFKRVYYRLKLILVLLNL